MRTVNCIVVALVILTAGAWAGELIWQANFSASDLRFSAKGGYDMVVMPKSRIINPPGAPGMPVVINTFSVPSGAAIASVEVISFQRTELPGTYNIAPTQPEISISATTLPNVPPDAAIYGSNSEYPVELASFAGRGNMCGYTLASVALRPLHYIPATGKLALYTNITYKVVYTEGNSEKVCTATQKDMFGQEVKKLVANPSDVPFNAPVVDNTNRSPMLPPGLHSYVIITQPPMDTVFQRLADWKTQRGLNARMVSVDWISGAYAGVDLAERVRNFIKDAQSTWGAEYVLLGGQGDDRHVYPVNQNIIPARHVFYIDDTLNHYVDEDSIPCDLYYSGLDGSWNANHNNVWGELTDGVDLYPDIWVGRAPVINVAQAQNFVNKVIEYESFPPGAYQKSIVLPATNGSGLKWWDQNYNATQSSEYITGLVSQDEWIIRRLYYPDSLNSQQQLVNALNEGYGFSHWIGHGNEETILIHDGRPEDIRFLNSDADNMTNGNNIGIANAISCYCGAMDPYDNDDCLAEHLINKVDGGMVAAIMNSRYGYVTVGQYTELAGPSELLDQSLFHGMLDFTGGDTVHHIGSALGGAKSTWAPFADAGGQYEWMRTRLYELNLFGDPETPIRPFSYIVSCPESVWTGYNDINVALQYTDLAGSAPVSGATAFAYLNGVPVDSEQTDGTGSCRLQFTTHSPDEELRIETWFGWKKLGARQIKIYREPFMATSLRDIEMPDKEHGWVVGDNGTILKLRNSTPESVFVNINGFDQHEWNFKCSSFPDTMHGWVVGYKNWGADKYRGVILRTENGGGHWSLKFSSESDLFGTTSDSLTPFIRVKMVKDNGVLKGYISCGNGYILKWLSIENRWLPIRPPIPDNGFYSPWYNSLWTNPSATFIWAGADNKCLFAKSTDEGNTWIFDTSAIFDHNYNWPPQTEFNCQPQLANLATWNKDYNNVKAGLSGGRIGKYTGGWSLQALAPEPVWFYGLDSLRLCGSEGLICDYQGNEIFSEEGTTFYDISSWRGNQPGGNVNLVPYSCAVGSNGRILYEEPFFYFMDFYGLPMPGYKQVTVHWETGGSEDEGIYLYEIYRSTSEIFYGEKIKTIYRHIDSCNSYTYVDNAMHWNTPYYYWIKPVMLNSRSKMFYIGCAAPTGFPAVQYPNPPVSIQAIDVPGDNGGSILVNWPAVPGATEYYVGRKKSNDIDFNPLAHISVDNFVDNSARDGESYQYAVASVVPYMADIDLASSLVVSNNVSSSDNVYPCQISLVNGYFDNNSEKINVFWQESDEPNMGGYWVCPEPLGIFASELPPSGVPDAYHVEHASPIDRTVYKYRVPEAYRGQTLGFAVTAMDRSGNIAPWSPTVNINTKVSTQSTSPLATAYNNGRKLLYDGDGNLHLAFVSNDSVLYQKSWDDGYSWTPTSGMASGGMTPTAALAVSGADIVTAWAAVTNNSADPNYQDGFTLRVGRMNANGWLTRVVVEKAGGIQLQYLCSPPAVTVKNGQVTLVYQERKVSGASGWYWKLCHAVFPISEINGNLRPLKPTLTVLDSLEGSGGTQIPITKATLCIDAKGGIHVAWEMGGEIYWRMYDPYTKKWKDRENVSNSAGTESRDPSLSMSGDVHLVWQEGDDVFHNKGNWGYSPRDGAPPGGGFNWAEAENVSNSPGTPSLWPVFDGGYAAWSEVLPSGNTEANCAYYSCYSWHQISDYSKNPTQPSNYPHIAYRQNLDGNRMTTVWTEGRGPLYSLIARDTASQVTPDYAALLGHEEPTIYTVKRGGYKSYPNGMSVDYDATDIQYYMPWIDATRENEVELTFYNPEANGVLQQKVYMNNALLGTVTIPSGQVSTFSKKIPADAVVNGEGILRVENKKGASCAKWQLLSYNQATGRGGGYDKSAASQPVASPIKPIAYRNELLQNAPNPCYTSTTIKYQLARDSKVKLVVYNTLGQMVRLLVDGEQQAGHHAITWDGKDNKGLAISSGIYMYRMNMDGFSEVKRLVLLK